MKKFIYSIFVLLFLSQVGCTPKSTHESKEMRDTASVISEKPADPGADEESGEDSGCPRGLPEPVLTSGDFKSTGFSLDKSSRTAIEVMNFNENTRLEVHHSGCEYYVLSFRFIYGSGVLDLTNRISCYEKLLTSLNAVSPSVQSPVDVAGGTAVLSAYLEELKNTGNLPEEPEGQFFGEGDLPGFATFGGIEENPEGTIMVEATFSLGPL